MNKNMREKKYRIEVKRYENKDRARHRDTKRQRKERDTERQKMRITE